MLRKIILIVLLVATVLWTAFIYSNSLKSGEQSGEQSSNVTEIVNKVASAVGVKEEIPHSTVRDMAHFTEFAVLSILLFADAVVAFDAFLKSHLPFAFIITAAAPVACFALAGVDELLQKFSDGRACQFTDVLLDTMGALCGALIATAVYFFIVGIRKRRARGRGDAEDAGDAVAF